MQFIVLLFDERVSARLRPASPEFFRLTGNIADFFVLNSFLSVGVNKKQFQFEFEKGFSMYPS